MGWIGRVPIYATTVIVAFYVTCMVGVAIALASGAESFLLSLTFNSDSVLRNYEIWRCLTYAFVNPPDPWFLVALIMLYLFGRDVEQFLGRTAFTRLYLGLILVGPCLLLGANLVTGQNFGLRQNWANFAIFIAFAAINPSAQLLFQVPAKVFAWIFLGISLLQLLAGRQWSEIAVLLATAGLAWYAVQRGAALNLEFLARLRPNVPLARKPHLRVVKNPDDEPIDPHKILDPILEKISQKGLASLSSRERQLLQQTRAALLEKEKH